jgi:hypothetical protein
MYKANKQHLIDLNVASQPQLINNVLQLIKNVKQGNYVS